MFYVSIIDFQFCLLACSRHFEFVCFEWQKGVTIFQNGLKKWVVMDFAEIFRKGSRGTDLSFLLISAKSVTTYFSWPFWEIGNFGV